MAMEFTRRFSLDERTVDTSKIHANLSNGVLVVTIPKVKKLTPVSIEITQDNMSDEGMQIEATPPKDENTAGNTVEESKEKRVSPKDEDTATDKSNKDNNGEKKN